MCVEVLSWGWDQRYRLFRYFLGTVSGFPIAFRSWEESKFDQEGQVLGIILGILPSHSMPVPSFCAHIYVCGGPLLGLGSKI